LYRCQPRPGGIVPAQGHRDVDVASSAIDGRFGHAPIDIAV